MPTYDYRCEHNNQVVEVKHGMNESISTWGELCQLTGLNPEDIPMETPVKRLATGGNVVSRSSLKENVPPCSVGGGCPSGGCGI